MRPHTYSIWYFFLLFSLCLPVSSIAQDVEEVNYVEFDPANPGTNDLITINLTGYFLSASSCDYVGEVSTIISGNEIIIDLAVLDTGNPPCNFFFGYLPFSLDVFVAPTDPGTYCVTTTGILMNDNITDNIRCVDVSSPCSDLMVNVTGTDTSCGSEDGSATASASGGQSPYSYTWSNGDSGSSITGLSTGTYIVTLTDANDCTDTGEINIQSGDCVAPEMVFVEGDVYNMGCTNEQNGCGPDEYPAHEVTLTDFFIGKYEVTQSQWNALIPEYTPDNSGFGTGDTHPVYNISWYDVVTFCNRLSLQEGYTPCYYFDENFTGVFDSLTGISSTYIDIYWNHSADGYRLPTEAEWEYAARGGILSNDYLYSGSNNVNAVAWWDINDDNSVLAQAVGTKAANELGLYDMSGNVWEWCWDWSSDTYYNESTACNPTGPISGTTKTERGGAWTGNSNFCRVASRDLNVLPGTRSFFGGFRLCRGEITPDECIIMCNRQSDSLSLVELYNAANGPNWNITWNLNTSIENWHGLPNWLTEGCPNSLQIINNGLEGPLPILTLPFLEALELPENNLNGNLPTFNNLPSLKRLSLFENSFTGEVIPSNFQLLTQLEILDLSDNLLQGELSNFPSLPQLYYLDFLSNRLEGAIPDFDSLPALNYLSFYDNDLDLPIPAFLACPNLDTLSVAENQLTFEDILPTIDELSSRLSFYDYSAQDSIYSNTSITASLGSLITIDLYIDETITDNVYQWYKDGQPYTTIIGNNNLTFASVQASDIGTYWVHITNPNAPHLTLESHPININILAACDRTADSLALVEFYNATAGPGWTNPWDLSSPMDNWIGVVLNSDGCVVELNLNVRSLNGSLIDFNLPHLEVFECASNTLSGNIPDFSGLPMLSYFRCDNSQVTGSIPNFSNLPELTYFQCNDNNLTGGIPDFSNISKLTTLICSENFLNSSIPNFSNLPLLEELNCEENFLSGEIPDFSNLPALEVLLCNRNQLSGNIPDFSNLPALIEFRCNVNSLSGSIPDFSNLPNLSLLAVTSNSLTGSIPNFSNLPNLVEFYCPFNNIDGTLPDLSNTPLLQVFNFHGNEIEGTIPDFSNLPLLWSLWAYDNNFSGSIPDLSDNCPNFRRFTYYTNEYTFEDILPTFTNIQNTISNNGGSIDYAPQDSIYTDTLITATLGSPLTIDLGIDENISNNVYQWYKDGQPYTNIMGNNNLFFASLQASDAGIYWVHITNPGAPDLTLESRSIEVQLSNASCEASLACIDMIDVVLNSDCQSLLTYDMILEGDFACLTADDFTISILDDNSTNGNTLDGVGSFTYLIECTGPNCNSSFGSCFGTVNGLDQAPPSFDCINGLSTILFPYDDNNDGETDGIHSIRDATDFIANIPSDCSEPITYSINRSGEQADINSNTIELTCSDTGMVDVEIWAWDALGNAAMCPNFILVQEGPTPCSSLANQLTFFTTSAVNSTPIGDIITVDIRVRNFDNISTTQYAVRWDSMIFQYNSLPFINGTDFNGLTSNNIGTPDNGGLDGQAVLSWFNPGFSGMSVPDSTIVFSLELTALDCGFSDVSIDSTYTGVQIEITDGNLQTVDYSTESISIESVCSTQSLTLSIPDTLLTTGESFCLPVSVENFTDVVGMGFTINYNANELQFDQVTNLNPNLPGFTVQNMSYPPNIADGFIGVNYIDFSLQGATLNNNDILFEICFTSMGLPESCSDITFTSDVAAIEFSDNNQEIIPFSGNGSTVCTEAETEPLEIIPGSVDVDPGEAFCVPIIVNNFSNILGMQFSVNFDPALFEFNSLTNINTDLPGFSDLVIGTPNEGTPDGTITLSYSPNPLAPQILSDSSILFEICLTANNCGNACSDFEITNTPTPIQFTDGDENLINDYILQTGTLCINDNGTNCNPTPPQEVSFEIGDAILSQGEMFCIPIQNVHAFEGMLSMAFSLSYDETILQYEGVQNLSASLPGFNESDHIGTPPLLPEGVVTFSYFDFDFPYNTISTGETIFEICFTAIGECSTCSPLDFSSAVTSIEFIDVNENTVSFSPGNGTACISPAASSTYQATLCPDESYTPFPGGPTFDIDNPNGIAFMACDSAVQVELDFYPINTVPVPVLLCPGDSTNVGGVFFGENNPGGIITIPNGDVVTGCDLLMDVMVEFYDQPTTSIDTTLCTGDTLYVNGVAYHADNFFGQQIFEAVTSNGCDSILEVNLNFYPSAIENITTTICPEDSLIINGIAYHQNNPVGLQTLSGMSSQGCDSIINISLGFFPEAIGNYEATLCSGDTVVINGITYYDTNSSGTQILSGLSSNGCDSTLIINLSFLDAIETSLNEVICEGETFIVGNNTYSASGLYVDTLSSASGCDSIITLMLTVNLPTNGQETQDICEGQTINWNGQVLSTTGTYTADLLNINGCDSTATLFLTVHSATTSSFSDSFCTGDLYNWAGINYAFGGEYTRIFAQVNNGCDSVVTLFLTEITTIPPTGNQLYEYCENEPLPILSVSVAAGTTVDWYDAPVNGMLLAENTLSFIPPGPGVYYAEARDINATCVSTNRLAIEVIETLNTIENTMAFTCDPMQANLDTVAYATEQGCDSIVITQYILLPISEPTYISTTSCDPADIGNDTLFYTNQFGCDSLVIAEINYAPLDTNYLEGMTCDLDSEGTFVLDLVSSQGCDSTVVLTLTFDAALISYAEIFSCNENTLGLDTSWLETPLGCDSLSIINYIPTPAIYTDIDSIICEGSGILIDGMYIDEEGLYLDSLSTPEGCDSILQINLTVEASLLTFIEDILCPGIPYEFGDSLLTTPGMYEQTLISTAGCDSIVSLILEEAMIPPTIAVNDEFIFPANQNNQLYELTANDTLGNSEDWTLQLLDTPQQGTINLEDEGTIRYTLTNSGYLGLDSFTYQLCPVLCPDQCSEASVVLAIKQDCVTEIEDNLPTGFTPDGDGINDLFDPIGEIDINCLQSPENGKLTIINRWGEIIHEADPYQPWDGRVNSRVVPQDTYYYILRFEVDEEIILRKPLHVLKKSKK